MYISELIGVSDSDIPIYGWPACNGVDICVARIPDRGSPRAILLRESYREGGKANGGGSASAGEAARGPK
jgi:hypothetical protein